MQITSNSVYELWIFFVFLNSPHCCASFDTIEVLFIVTPSRCNKKWLVHWYWRCYNLIPYTVKMNTLHMKIEIHYTTLLKQKHYTTLTNEIHHTILIRLIHYTSTSKFTWLHYQNQYTTHWNQNSVYYTIMTNTLDYTTLLIRKDLFWSYYCAKKDIPGAPEYSHVVPHRTTDSALQCLTAQIGRDAVSSLWYGPR